MNQQPCTFCLLFRMYHKMEHLHLIHFLLEVFPKYPIYVTSTTNLLQKEKQSNEYLGVLDVFNQLCLWHILEHLLMYENSLPSRPSVDSLL